MAWAYLDDGFCSHPRVVAAESRCDTAPWLFVAGLLHARRHLTSGLVDKAMLRRLTGIKRPEVAAAVLVDVGLWLDEGTAWRIHDYDDWNASEDAQREARSAKAQRAAKTRWQRPAPDGEARDAQAMLKQCSSNAQALPEQCQPEMPEQCHSLSLLNTTTKPPFAPLLAEHPPPPQAASQKQANRRRTRAPDAMPLDATMRAWALERAPNVTDLDAETARFLDFHRAKGSLMADWRAAWRTWMTSPLQAHAARKPTTSANMAVIAATVDGMVERGQLRRALS